MPDDSFSDQPEESIVSPAILKAVAMMSGGSADVISKATKSYGKLKEHLSDFLGHFQSQEQLQEQAGAEERYKRLTNVHNAHDQFLMKLMQQSGEQAPSQQAQQPGFQDVAPANLPQKIQAQFLPGMSHHGINPEYLNHLNAGGHPLEFEFGQGKKEE